MLQKNKRCSFLWKDCENVVTLHLECTEQCEFYFNHTSLPVWGSVLATALYGLIQHAQYAEGHLSHVSGLDVRSVQGNDGKLPQ